MPVTVSSFKAEFPEFEGAPDSLVTAKLLDAENRVPTSIWGSGDLRDMGIKYMLADLLSRAPFGRRMKLVLQDGTTAFTATLKELKRRVAMGVNRVT